MAMEIANETRAQLGDIELEVSFNQEFESLENMTRCEKDPTHTGFIKIKLASHDKFDRKDLPEHWRHISVERYVCAMIERTVFLQIKHISNDRPLNFPRQGRNSFGLLGSAFIKKAERMTKEERNVGVDRYKKCPCKANNNCPVETWIRVTLETARHNLYNLEEVKAADAYFGFDSENKLSYSNKIKLYEIKKGKESDMDGILIYGAIHEEDCNEKWYDDLPTPNLRIWPKDKTLVVVTSHPHGCAKRVSTGWLLGEDRIRHSPQSTGNFHKVKVTHDAPTCPGSSGAPVKVFTQDYKDMFVHSKGQVHGNCSGQQIIRISNAESNEQNNNTPNNFTTTDSCTSEEFIFACMNGQEERVKLLLEKGADARSKDQFGKTALMWTCIRGHEGCVELLLKHDADINMSDDYEFTALMYACQNGHEECLKLLLLNESSDVKKVDTFGKTALMWACIRGHEECVELLLEHDADVNMSDGYKFTALMYACQNGHKECLKLLLRKGADIHKEDIIGKTAFNLADYFGNKECKKLIVLHSFSGMLRTGGSQPCLMSHKYSRSRRKSCNF